MAKYKIKDYGSGEVLVIKSLSKGVMQVSNPNSISVLEFLEIDGDFPDSEGYNPTTKKVFDAEFEKAVEKLKEVVNGKV